MKDYIEKRVLELANYIINSGSTVRHTAREFNISKSTVHTVVSISVGWSGALNLAEYKAFKVKTGFLFLPFLLTFLIKRGKMRPHIMCKIERS